MVHQRLFSVGTKVRQIRESKGWTTTELASRAGMSKQSIYKYERDIVHNMPYDTIGRLASALEVNPAYLVGWSNSMERTPDLIESSSNEVVSDIL